MCVRCRPRRLAGRWRSWAKGRVERSFQTAQDRLVKELRVARARTLEQANRVLEKVFLPWREKTRTVRPAHPDDAHRRLQPELHLDAVFSQVEQRQVLKDYTFRFHGKLYRIEPDQVRTGLRGGVLRIEQRLDGSMAVAFQGRYLRYRMCPAAERPATVPTSPTARHRTSPRLNRAARAGWKASIYKMPCRCGRRWKAPAAEPSPEIEGPKEFGTPGKSGPAAVAFTRPRPPLRGFTKAAGGP